MADINNDYQYRFDSPDSTAAFPAGGGGGVSGASSVVTPADLEALCDIAGSAAQAVMEVYASACEVRHKDDRTPLTQADVRADAIIAAGLARAFAAIPVVSEESGVLAEVGASRFFLVDPLDGTVEFLKRNGEFTVNIALVDAGAVLAGVVVAPALGETFSAAQGLGAWKSVAGVRQRLRVRAYDGRGPLAIVGSRSHGADRLDQWRAGLPVAHTFIAVGSSLKFCRVAEGVADVYPRLGPTCQWDTAAAQCIVECAGGRVLDLAGEPLRYGADRPRKNPQFVAFGADAVWQLIGPGLRERPA